MGVLEDIQTAKQYLTQHSDTIKTTLSPLTDPLSLTSLSLPDLSHTLSISLSSLTSHFTSVLYLLDRVEERIKTIEEREKEGERERKRMKERVRDLEVRVMNCAVREEKVKKKEDQLGSTKEKEEEEREAAKKAEVEEYIATLPANIRLNVSGIRFLITPRALLQFGNVQFVKQILSSPSDGEFLIDRDPISFICVLNSVLNLKLCIPQHQLDHSKIISEFQFFKVPFYEFRDFESQFRGSIIENFAAVMRQWLKLNTIECLFKASINGFSIKEFHKLCDNKGPTLVLIKAKDGSIFGGYTPLSWDSSGLHKSHPDMFIFTLSNPHSLPPSKFHLKKNDKNGIQCYANYGPRFGVGPDISVGENSHLNGNKLTFTNFAWSYVDTTGKGNKLFTSDKYFVVREMEVYSVT